MRGYDQQVMLTRRQFGLALVALSLVALTACGRDWTPYDPREIPPCDGAEEPTTRHCYKLSTFEGDWHAARADCESWGGDLAALTSSAEHEFVNELFSERGPYWIGGNDIAEEGVYEWSSGEPWGYEAWESGEPTDDGGDRGEDCIDIYDDASAGPLFGDNPCDSSAAYVCERHP